MAVIKTNEWETEEAAKPPDPQMFGFQDITSDYYQVLIEKERPRACKIAWGFIVFIIFGFTVYMVYQLLANYFHYNSFDVATIQWVQNVTFPAVTICSANNINHTKLEDALYSQPGELFEHVEFLMHQLKTWNGTGDVKQRINVSDFMELSAFEAKHGAIHHRYGPDFKDYTIHARYNYMFQEVHLNFDDDKDAEYPTELGNCFEFNDDGEHVQNIRGVHGGFTIDLDVNMDTYMTSTSTKGFYVFIRDQDETVLLNQGGYIIAPGTETFMKLHERVMTRLTKPYGTCRDEPNPYTEEKDEKIHYMTVRECDQVKKIELMVQACECIPWYVAERLESRNGTSQLNKLHAMMLFGMMDTSEIEIPTTYTKADVCNFVNQSICEAIVSNILREPDNSIRQADCHEPCNYSEWDVEITSTQFPPTERYYNKYLSFQGKPEPGKFTYDYVSDNLIRLHIYYDDIKVTNVKQTKAYQIQNFIAEFGGTVDLFIGFSFFTVFQLIEIGIAACFWKFCSKKIEDNTQASTVIVNK